MIFENKYDLEDYNRKKLLISKGMDTDCGPNLCVLVIRSVIRSELVVREMI